MKHSITAALFCLTAFSVSAEEMDRVWFFDITGGRGAYLHSSETSELLGYDSAARKPIGDYTMRYGTSFEVLRNQYAYQSAPQTDFSGVDTLEISASRHILDSFELGMTLSHRSYFITNIHANLRQYSGPYNDFNILTFGVISFPVLRDMAVNGEFVDPLILHDGHPLNTLSGLGHASVHFGSRSFDPFLGFSIGAGKDLFRSLRTFEYGPFAGARVFLSEGVYITGRAALRFVQFSGHAGGREVSAILREPSIQAGVGIAR